MTCSKPARTSMAGLRPVFAQDQASKKRTRPLRAGSREPCSEGLLQTKSLIHEPLQSRPIDDVVSQFLIRKQSQGRTFGIGDQF
jgi:hypothetical protein